MVMVSFISALRIVMVENLGVKPVAGGKLGKHNGGGLGGVSRCCVNHS